MGYRLLLVALAEVQPSLDSTSPSLHTISTLLVRGPRAEIILSRSLSRQGRQVAEVEVVVKMGAF